jgi:hypothetical protein
MKIWITLFALVFTCQVIAQTQLLCITWNLMHASKRDSNAMVKLEWCRSSLFFDTDGTYNGRGCCNRSLPKITFDPYSRSNEYIINHEGEIKMNPPFSTSIYCTSKEAYAKGKPTVNPEPFIFTCWTKANRYRFSADTLILSCSNGYDLYYLKTK